MREMNLVGEQRPTLIPYFPFSFFFPPLLSVFHPESLERKKLRLLCFSFSLISVKYSLDAKAFSVKCKLCSLYRCLSPSLPLSLLFPMDREVVELDFLGVVWPGHISHFS